MSNNFSYAPANSRLERLQQQNKQAHERFLRNIHFMNGVEGLFESDPSLLLKAYDSKKWYTDQSQAWVKNRLDSYEKFFNTPFTKEEWVKTVNTFIDEFAPKVKSENVERLREPLLKRETFNTPLAKRWIYEKRADWEAEVAAQSSDWRNNLAYKVYLTRVDNIFKHYIDEAEKEALLKNESWDSLSINERLKNLENQIQFIPNSKEEYQERVKNIHTVSPLPNFTQVYNSDNWRAIKVVNWLIHQETDAFNNPQNVNKETYSESPFRNEKKVKGLISQLSSKREEWKAIAEQIINQQAQQQNNQETSLRRGRRYG